MTFVQRRLRSVAARLGLALGLVYAAFPAPPAGAQGRAASAMAVLACPSKPSNAVGRRFAGSLDFQNFAHQDLRNADFRNATIRGTVFVGADLSGADFSGATFVDSQRPALVNDFTFAKLDSACFIGAKFEAPTYFTHADLTCADFSQTTIEDGRAIFGPDTVTVDLKPLTPGGALRSCRLAFRQAKMNCELLSQWKTFDMTQAVISACFGQLQGADFRNAVLDGVNFFQANLKGARFDSAQLHGANLGSTNLENASLAGAQLGVDQSGSAGLKGSLNGIYAPGVDLSSADLRGVDLSGACIYEGTRKASLALARLDSANFTNAYLPGMVFPVFTRNTLFNGALLVNAQFPLSDLTGASFIAAYLQGASFVSATAVASASLLNAATSTAAGTLSFRYVTGAPDTEAYAATALGRFAADSAVTCPDGNAGPCNTAARLVPPLAPKYPLTAACTLAPQPATASRAATPATTKR